MPGKMSTASLTAATLFIISIAVQAANPGDVENQTILEDDSFFQGWFMWGKGDEAKRKKEDEDSQKAKKVKESKSGKHKKQDDGSFSDSDRSRILEYYKKENTSNKKHKKKKIPPGLQKKLDRGGELPPGWRAKVQRGEILDAELMSRSEALPYELRKHLPVLKDGTTVRRIGDKVIRVLEGNATVLDVIDIADVVLNH